MERTTGPEGDMMRIQDGWDVYGSDDQKIGSVAEVHDMYIVAHKGFLFPKDLYVPNSAFDHVEDQRVYLTVPKGEVDHQGWENPPSEFSAAMTQPAPETFGEKQQFSGTVPREEARIEHSGNVDMQGADVGGEKMFEKDVADTEMAAMPATGRMDVVEGQSGVPTMGQWEQMAPRYRAHWQERFGASGQQWSEAEPAYRFTSERMDDPRFRGRSWGDVEPNLRREWETRYPNYPWTRSNVIIRDAWENPL